MKTKLAALALLCAAMICSESDADLLGRMLGRGGCGECQTASTCCDTPAPACGQDECIDSRIGHSCRLFKCCEGGCGMFSRRHNPCDTGCDSGCDSGCGQGGGFFSKMFNGGCGCGRADNDCCGCPDAMIDTCGPNCDCGATDTCCSPRSGLFSGGLFSKHGSRGCGGCDSGCDAPAPCAAPAPSCGCNDAPNCGCRQHRFKGMFSRVGSLGCGSCGSQSTCDCTVDPMPSCGCETAPNCGCGNGRSKHFGSHFSRNRQSCGCGDVSCDGGCGGCKPGLLDHFRNHRANRAAACGSNDCCTTMYPNSGCPDCGNGCVNGNVVPAPTMTPAPTTTPAEPAPPVDPPTVDPKQAPVKPIPQTTSKGFTERVITPATDAASHGISVDPSFFTIKNRSSSR